MKLYAPKYYKKFKCIAGECEHSCCIGWEIDIDSATYAEYEKMKADYGREIRKSISLDGTPHFELCAHDRCPHLDEKGLCRIILNVGENYLCQICREHPRFYNEFDDHTEAGIGLVCEEACRLILNHDGAFELIGDDGSKMELPGYVKNIYDCAKPINERLKDISGGRRAESKLRAEIFDGMEVMDPKWSTLLSKIIEATIFRTDSTRGINLSS